MSITLKLTDRTVANFELSDGKTQEFIRDMQQPGFGVRVSARTKAFIYEAKVHGKNRRITIGSFPDWSTEQARKQAKKLAVDMDSGIDPNKQKRENRQKGITLGKALEDYLASNSNLKDRTRQDYKQVIERYASDWLNHSLFEITAAMIEKKHQQVATRSHAQANLLMRYIRAIYNSHSGIARMNGITVPENPTEILNIKKQWCRVEPRTTVVPTDKTKAFWDALTKQEEQNDLAATLYKVMLLTGLRVGETLNILWADVDLATRTILLRDTKNRTHHTLPMGDYLFGIFANIKRYEPYVFSTSRGRRTNLRGFKEKVLREAGVWINPHDLRRTFTSVAADHLTAYVLKRLTNHKNGADVTLSYVIKSVADLREPMQKVENAILELAGQA